MPCVLHVTMPLSRSLFSTSMTCSDRQVAKIVNAYGPAGFQSLVM